MCQDNHLQITRLSANKIFIGLNRYLGLMIFSKKMYYHKNVNLLAETLLYFIPFLFISQIKHYKIVYIFTIIMNLNIQTLI